MLTRLEVDGFKNLLGLEVDFGPFTCIAGPNGVGKSNVFDAIHFLSLLAGLPIMEAVQRVRSTRGQTSDPKDLLWTDGGRANEMSFAAEMIVPHSVKDDFGRQGEVSSTFLRYELRLGYEPPSTTTLTRLGRLVLLYESLRYIKAGDASEHIPWSSVAFRQQVILNKRRVKSGFISTHIDEQTGIHTINIHQDGGSRGQPKPSPARTASKTAVGITNTVDDPTILAARQEMQRWRMIALEPTAMRSPDPFTAKSEIQPNGQNMAATLYHLANSPPPREDEEEEVAPDPREVYTAVANRLCELVDAREIRVDRDDRRELLTIELRQGVGPFFPARSLSDGTLRFLALSILGTDPSVEGLICMEEPENGIHPARLPAMVDLLRGMAVDPTETPGYDNPLRQIIVNTHSPGFVQLQHDRDLLFAKAVKIRHSSLGPARAIRLRPRRGTWRSGGDVDGVGEGEILAYLLSPPGTQLSLDSPEVLGHAG